MSDRQLPIAFSVVTTHVDAQVDLAVSGEVDVANSAQFSAAIEDAARLAGTGGVVLDLAAVTFFDSSAITALVRSRRQLEAGGSTLRVGAMSRVVEGVLEVVGMVDWVRAQL